MTNTSLTSSFNIVSFCYNAVSVYALVTKYTQQQPEEISLRAHKMIPIKYSYLVLALAISLYTVNYY